MSCYQTKVITAHGYDLKNEESLKRQIWKQPKNWGLCHVEDWRLYDPSCSCFHYQCQRHKKSFDNVVGHCATKITHTILLATINIWQISTFPQNFIYKGTKLIFPVFFDYFLFICYSLHRCNSIKTSTYVHSCVRQTNS